MAKSEAYANDLKLQLDDKIRLENRASNLQSLNYVTNLLKKLAGFSSTYIQNSKILEENEADLNRLKSLNTPIGDSLLTPEFISSFDPLFQEQMTLIKTINDLCR